MLETISVSLEQVQGVFAAFGDHKNWAWSRYGLESHEAVKKCMCSEALVPTLDEELGSGKGGNLTSLPPTVPLPSCRTKKSRNLTSS